ncbi:unnamed protein product [Camellia sinensis]
MDTCLVQLGMISICIYGISGLHQSPSQFNLYLLIKVSFWVDGLYSQSRLDQDHNLLSSRTMLDHHLLDMGLHMVVNELLVEEAGHFKDIRLF